MRVRRAVSHRNDDRNIRVVSVGDERLRAIQDPAVATADGRHSRTAGVRTRGRLGQSPRSDELATRELRDVLLPLPIIPRQKNVI